jgi:hypothetical protein
LKAAADIKTPAQYLARLPAERRTALAKLHSAIRRAAPSLRPRIAYGMIGYGCHHYRYASGREGESPVIALASQKQHISLYLCLCDGTGYLPEKNKARLGKVSVGKSCIRFRRLEDLNLPVAMQLVKTAARLARQRR